MDVSLRVILLLMLIGEVGITDVIERVAEADTPELNEAIEEELRAAEVALMVEGLVIADLERSALIP